MKIMNNTKIHIIITIIGAILLVIAVILMIFKNKGSNVAENVEVSSNTTSAQLQDTDNVTPPQQQIEIPSEELPTGDMDIMDDDEAEAIFYTSAVKQILTTGDWISIGDSFEDYLGGYTDLVFTDNTLTLNHRSNEALEDDAAGSVTYTYEILSATSPGASMFAGYGNIYEFKWLLEDLATGASHETNASIVEFGENGYEITCQSFPYTATYSKNVNITFTEPAFCP